MNAPSVVSSASPLRFQTSISPLRQERRDGEDVIQRDAVLSGSAALRRSRPHFRRSCRPSDSRGRVFQAERCGGSRQRRVDDAGFDDRARVVPSMEMMRVRRCSPSGTTWSARPDNPVPAPRGTKRTPRSASRRRQSHLACRETPRATGAVDIPATRPTRRPATRRDARAHAARRRWRRAPARAPRRGTRRGPAAQSADRRAPSEVRSCGAERLGAPHVVRLGSTFARRADDVERIAPQLVFERRRRLDLPVEGDHRRTADVDAAAIHEKGVELGRSGPRHPRPRDTAARAIADGGRASGHAPPGRAGRAAILHALAGVGAWSSRSPTPMKTRGVR